MTRLNDTQLRRLDLTLLLVFDEAVRSRRFNHVADRLGLTPSAISHAMTRLRSIFEDPLFRRVGNAVVPTPRALTLAGPVARALAELRQAMDEGRSFDPARLERSFRIAAPDAVIATLLPSALPVFARLAPLARFSIVIRGREAGMAELREGRLDLAIGVYPDTLEGFTRSVLSRETFVVVCRRGHPLAAAQRPSLEDFLRCDHLLVSAAGDFEGAVDTRLGEMGLRRTVVAALPQFLPALAAVAHSDAIVTVSRSVAQRYGGLFNLASLEPPLDLPGFDVVLLSGPFGQNDPAIAWLTQSLLDVAGPGAADPADGDKAPRPSRPARQPSGAGHAGPGAHRRRD